MLVRAFCLVSRGAARSAVAVCGSSAVRSSSRVASSSLRAVTLRPTPLASLYGFQQSRNSRVKVYGPFTPPKQLTFEEVEARVLKAIKAWDRFPQDKSDLLTLDANFVSDLGLDSLDHVEIVMSLEDEFGFEIPDDDAAKLKSARDVFKYICEREDVYE